jgi:hypothetical protein
LRVFNPETDFNRRTKRAVEVIRLMQSGNGSRPASTARKDNAVDGVVVDALK